MTLKNRVLQFIERKGITTQNFERICGLSNAAVSKMGDNTRRSTLDKISNAFPEINISWLLTGEGPMLHSPQQTNHNNAHEEPDAVPNQPASDPYRLVPLINIDSVGGMDSPNQFLPSEQYILKMMPFTEAHDGDVAILQTGNSMYPTIPAGSVLLIREVTDWREYFGYGGIFVLWLKDGRRITKEVRRYDADPQNYVWCVSYNPDIADEELPRSLIRGVWKVVKYIADFGW